MSRAERIVKKAIKRHHLHLETEGLDELTLGLLFNRDSRTLVSARGVIGETDTVVQVRELKTKLEPNSTTYRQEATLVVVELLSPMHFLVTAHKPAEEITVLTRHINSAWVSEPRSGRIISYPPDQAESLALIERAATHLPPRWYAEGAGNYLHIFCLPAATEEPELEDVIRLAGELRFLLVAA